MKLGLALLVSAWATSSLPAFSETCDATTFSSDHGDAYLKAETALFADDRPEYALEKSDEIWRSDLNCYEESAVRRLRAAIFIELDDLPGAIEMLKPLLSDSSLSKDERSRHAYNIGQLYLAQHDTAAAQPYLDLSKEIAGQPD